MTHFSGFRMSKATKDDRALHGTKHIASDNTSASCNREGVRS